MSAQKSPVRPRFRVCRAALSPFFGLNMILCRRPARKPRPVRVKRDKQFFCSNSALRFLISHLPQPGAKADNRSGSAYPRYLAACTKKRAAVVSSADGPERGQETKPPKAAVSSPSRREAARREQARRDTTKRPSRGAWTGARLYAPFRPAPLRFSTDSLPDRFCLTKPVRDDRILFAFKDSRCPVFRT